MSRTFQWLEYSLDRDVGRSRRSPSFRRHLMTQRETANGNGGGPGLDRRLLLLGAVVVLGTVMTVLDLTVVNVAIPTLGRAFQTSISTIQWVLTGYLLAFASVIPLTGWASERFGAK